MTRDLFYETGIITRPDRGWLKIRTVYLKAVVSPLSRDEWQPYYIRHFRWNFIGDHIQILYLSMPWINVGILKQYGQLINNNWDTKTYCKLNKRGPVESWNVVRTNDSLFHLSLNDVSKDIRPRLGSVVQECTTSGTLDNIYFYFNYIITYR